jgi:hypothetical protein
MQRTEMISVVHRIERMRAIPNSQGRRPARLSSDCPLLGHGLHRQREPPGKVRPLRINLAGSVCVVSSPLQEVQGTGFLRYVSQSLRAVGLVAMAPSRDEEAIDQCPQNATRYRIARTIPIKRSWLQPRRPGQTQPPAIGDQRSDHDLALRCAGRSQLRLHYGFRCSTRLRASSPPHRLPTSLSAAI